MNICYSGGSKGADVLFGKLALEAGHDLIHWSFQNHHIAGQKLNAKVLSYPQLMEADQPLKMANEFLKRQYPTRSEYVNNLLRRNYWQIKEADSVYAAMRFTDDMIPLGGTSWAIIMAAMKLRRPKAYIFNINDDKWYRFPEVISLYGSHQRLLTEIDFTKIPKPQGKYAGIGASDLPENGIQAIESLYK